MKKKKRTRSPESLRKAKMTRLKNLKEPTITQRLELLEMKIDDLAQVIENEKRNSSSAYSSAEAALRIANTRW